MSFRNRMAEHGAVKVQDVKPHPRNWRLHPEAQRKLLVEVLGDVGWVDGLLINRTTGLLLDGHARLEEAKKAGLTEVPATFVELTEAEETMVLALLDPLSSFAYADADLLQQVAAAAGPIAPIDLYISGKVEEQPEEGSITLADAHTVTVHVGDIAFSIPHTAYVQWRDSLIQQVGMKRRKLIGAVAEGSALRLLPLDDIHAAHYNPRRTDPARLQYVRLSLRKLGFLLPIFAMADGEIASGHQRHLAARQLGWTHAPVETLKPMSDDERRSVNVLFNVATNDSNARTTAEQMFQRLEELHFAELLEAMPDKEGDDRFPCLRTVDIRTSDLVAANSSRWSDFQRAGAASLAHAGGFQPIIATANLRIVNGLGRLQLASERDWPVAPVVFVSDDEAMLAEGMLNLLSMDFALEDFSADFLRHMAFRRASLKKQRLGSGIAHLVRLASAYELDPARPESAELLLQRLGPRILDFGSGRGEDAALMRQMGLDCVDFEPFAPFPDRDEVDVEASIAGGRRLLAEIADGKVWTSILLLSVLNSVPFAADRQHILALTSALAAGSTTVFATLMGVTNRWAELNAADGDHSAANAGGQMFVLNHEPRTTMSLKMNRPKVQHYFTRQEAGGLFRAHFRDVTMQNKSHKWLVEARQPRGVSREALRAAIAFEFDVPLPGGRRMGLAGEAVRAFEQRLGIRL